MYQPPKAPHPPNAVVSTKPSLLLRPFERLSPSCHRPRKIVHISSQFSQTSHSGRAHCESTRHPRICDIVIEQAQCSALSLLTRTRQSQRRACGCDAYLWSLLLHRRLYYNPTSAAKPTEPKAYTVVAYMALHIVSRICALPKWFTTKIRPQGTSETAGAPPPPPGPSQLPTLHKDTYKALHDYRGRSANELSIFEDEIIEIVRKENNGKQFSKPPFFSNILNSFTRLVARQET
jgi:hypothetical protein